MTTWQSKTPIIIIKKKNPYCTLLEPFKHSGPRTIIKRRFFDLLFSLFFLSPRLQYKQHYTNEGSDALRGTISNLPAAHSWALSHLKVLGEICASIYSFRENVRNNCPEMRKSSSLLRFIGGVAVSSQGFFSFFFLPKLNSTPTALPRRACALKVLICGESHLFLSPLDEFWHMWKWIILPRTSPREVFARWVMPHLKSTNLSDLQERSVIGQRREPVNWSCI